MMYDSKPYPDMIDSGVSWLGDVPRHWEVLPNRAVFTEINERGHPNEDMLSVTITRGIIQQRALLDEGSKKDSSNLDKSAYKLVQPGDIAYNKMRAWQGAIGVSDYRGIISPAYVVERPRDGADSRYLHYLLRTPAFAKEAGRWSYGITSDMWSLRPEHFKMIYTCLPPLPEQAAIVRFLDHADRRIRRAIRAKQRLIALLNEQKQAIIYHAVTRGLDPNAQLKPSGVEWLGEIPAHWDVLFLGRSLRRIEQGWSPVAAEGEIMPEQWAVLTLSSVKRGVFNSKAIKPVPLSAKVPCGIEIKDGNLLLTRSNTRALVGDTCIVESARPKTVLCDLIYRLTTDPTIFDQHFLMLQLLSPIGRRQIERDARGSSGTMPKISQRHIRGWRILVPPLEEQLGINEAVNTSSRDINVAIDRVQREIDLLREYSTCLIADVVTGKLDVRDAALRLPDELDEPESLDDVAVLDDEGEAGGDTDLGDSTEEDAP